MGRNKEFDADQALDQALRVFWEKGYEATSVQDLVEAMGVNRASLYQSFGNKHDLFLKVLERYGKSDQNIEHATACVAPGLARIEAALRVAAEQSESDPRGCMIVNAVVELGALDKDMRRLGDAARTQLEQFFASSLDDAEQRREIPAGKDRSALARFLTNTLFGLRVTAKTGAPPDVIRGIVDFALRSIKEH